MNATAVTLKTQHALTFGAHEVKTITREGQRWISNKQLTDLLGYADEKSVHRLYTSHGDEFTHMMARVFRVTTAGGKQAMRFFSLRGAHLIAMFARTPIAKAFRIWVLNILDREVADLKAQVSSGYRIDEDDRNDLQGLCTHMEYVSSWFPRVYPGIRSLSPRLAGAAHDHFVDGVCFARGIVRRHGLESRKDAAASNRWDASHTELEEHRRMGRAA